MRKERERKGKEEREEKERGTSWALSGIGEGVLADCCMARWAASVTKELMLWLTRFGGRLAGFGGGAACETEAIGSEWGRLSEGWGC